jgi:hypothetical protein
MLRQLTCLDAAGSWAADTVVVSVFIFLMLLQDNADVEHGTKSIHRYVYFAQSVAESGTNGMS